MVYFWWEIISSTIWQDDNTWKIKFPLHLLRKFVFSKKENGEIQPAFWGEVVSGRKYSRWENNVINFMLTMKWNQIKFTVRKKFIVENLFIITSLSSQYFFLFIISLLAFNDKTMSEIYYNCTDFLGKISLTSTYNFVAFSYFLPSVNK